MTDAIERLRDEQEDFSEGSSRVVVEGADLRALLDAYDALADTNSALKAVNAQLTMLCSEKANVGDREYGKLETVAQGLAEALDEAAPYVPLGHVSVYNAARALAAWEEWKR